VQPAISIPADQLYVAYNNKVQQGSQKSTPLLAKQVKQFIEPIQNPLKISAINLAIYILPYVAY
jgi:hypothetical protein